MEFSQQEKDLIKENAQKIKTYLETEIAPYLSKTIRIKFGGEYTSPKTFNTTSTYVLNIYAEGEEFHLLDIDGNTTALKCSLTTKVGAPDDLCTSHSREGAYALIKDWKAIKNQLLNEVDRYKKSIDMLERFEI